MSNNAGEKGTWANWRSAAGHALATGLPMVLVCAMLTVILHHLHWLDAADASAMRWVMDVLVERANRPDAPPKEQVKVSQRIHVLEVTPTFRIKHFGGDPGALTTDDIDNVGGVAPIARKQMTRLLHLLAGRLDGMPPAQRPRVVAIDVDLAPLSTDPQEVTDAMSDALVRLKSYANVLVVVWPRRDESQRLRRNRFMVAAGCDSSGDAALRAVGGLYFVSSRIFHDAFSYPVRFPFSHMDRPDDVFPSLGNALHIALHAPQSPGAASSLQRLCRSATAAIARQPAGTSALPEDLPAEAGLYRCEEGAWCIEQYWKDRRWMNWHLLETDHIRPVPLGDFSELDAACAPGVLCLKPDDTAIGAGALILSVSGGGKHDRVEAAHGADDAISGANLHALQALSSRQDLRLDEHKGYNLLADLLIGILFVGASAAVFGAVSVLRRAGWESTGKAISIVVPLLLAVGLAWCALRWLSPKLVMAQAWCNPIYILVGLLLHAYHEATHSAPHETGLGDDAAHGGAAPAADFTFGLVDWHKADNTPDALLPVAVCWIAVLLGLIVLAGKSPFGLVVAMFFLVAGWSWQFRTKGVRS